MSVDSEPWGVLGSGGFVGSAIVRELHRRGVRVRKIHAPRLEADPRATAAELAEHARRGSTANELARQLKGVRIVVNAAGLASPSSPPTPELFGANALLPAVVAEAARIAGVARTIHVSSAAVQGRRRVLDETSEVEPFSPYSRSKSVGEQVLERERPAAGERVIVRATSVQGEGRPTTERLRKFGSGPFASVAAPGTRPTPVSSVFALAELVVAVGAFPGPVAPIVLQPWEGLTTADVMAAASGRAPRLLPTWFCSLAVGGGYLAARIFPRLGGLIRRLELLWWGQSQVIGWAASVGIVPNPRVLDVLRGKAADPISGI